MSTIVKTVIIMLALARLLPALAFPLSFRLSLARHLCIHPGELGLRRLRLFLWKELRALWPTV